MVSGDQQLSLFRAEEVIKKVEDKKKDESAQVTPSPKLSLNKLYCDTVDGYLLEGVQSATEMSERLIGNKEPLQTGLCLEKLRSMLRYASILIALIM